MGINRLKIHKVSHFVSFKGKTEGPYTTDLLWEEGRWHLVFDWTRGYAGKSPRKRISVSEQELEEGGPGYILREPLSLSDRRLGSWFLSDP